MKQENQVKLLIFSCFLILAGLISIQYYLIRNTFNLTKDKYLVEVKKNIEPIVEAPEIDSLEDIYVERLKFFAAKKAEKTISSSEFQSKFKFLTDSVRQAGNEFIASQLKDYPILKEVNIRFQLTQIIFSNHGVADTILKLSEPPIVFIGKTFDSNSIFNISNGTVKTNHQWDRDNPDEKFNIDFDYSHLSSVDMDIANWQQKVWGKMLWMLAAAIFLIFAVIFLFFRMYRALIKQKKIAEVKTDFANNITHELKTPLASLNLIVKSFQNEEIHQNPDSMKELIQTLARQNKRMQNIVDRVMESSVDKQKLHLEKVEINEFLQEFISDYHSETHQIHSEIEAEKLELKTDTFQLGRVIQNLLQNAEKYSPENSLVTVKSYRKNSDYIIEIQDEGRGIPAEEQKKIFEKFYRVPEGNLHNTKGLGLGLFICKQIMESLGGGILVQSSLRKGSMFILKIPM